MQRMLRRPLLLLAGLVAAAGCAHQPTVGSKAFTESVILGELISQVAEHDGAVLRHRPELGGTGYVWEALVGGDIDLYPDYTGTISEFILKEPELADLEEIRAGLKPYGVLVSDPLGFENAYAIGVKEEFAAEHNIQSISDLKDHPDLVFGFGNEFFDRPDGWPSLQKKYELPQSRVRGLDHNLAYKALVGGDIQAMDVYATDAMVDRYGIRVLQDDRGHFPRYSSVILYRADLEARAPKVVEAIRRLEGNVPYEQMLRMNVMVDAEGISEARAAGTFRAEVLGLGKPIPPDSAQEKWLKFGNSMLIYTGQHMLLVIVSLVAAIAVAVPLGVVAAKRPQLSQVILSVAEIIQTIPGLALLILLITPVRMMGFSVVGPAPAIIALFLYSLLPVIRNTYTGIHDIPESMRESATALGLTRRAQLWQIELPLASRMILAGIKTTAVINVGYATLGGLIGAGGYGQLIMQGLRTGSESTMLEGAIPAAILALVVKWLFEYLERFLVPRGLRIKK